MEFERVYDRIRASLDDKMPWSWVASTLYHLLAKYPSGLTDAIIFSEMELQWENSVAEYHKGVTKKFESIDAMFEGTATLDSVFELTTEAHFNCLEVTSSLTAVFIIVSSSSAPTLQPRVLTFFSPPNPRRVEMYLHQRFYFLVQEPIYRAALFDKTPRLLRVTSARLPPTARTGAPRLLPTEHIIVMLTSETDEAFVRSCFGGQKLEDVERGRGREFRIWVKIVHIDPVIHTLSAFYSGGRSKRLNIYISDMAPDAENAVLTLYDEQVALAGLFRKGDCLGIFRPYISPRSGEDDEPVTFEYGTATVIFCMSAEDPMVIAAAASQIQYHNQAEEAGQAGPAVVPRDEQGFADCQSYLERVYIKDLVPQMLNVTLLGRVVALAENNPIVKDGINMDRYAIRIADHTGRTDVTLWDSVGRSACRLRPGQHILLTGLSTSSWHRSSRGEMAWHVNGSEACGTEIGCVSSLKSLLASSAVRRAIPLCDAAEFDQFQCCAVVTAWGFDGGERFGWNEGQEDKLRDVTVLAHTECHRPLTTAPLHILHCTFCRRPVDQVTESARLFRSEDAGTLCWLLDDGTGEPIVAKGGGDVAAELLGMTPVEYLAMSIEKRVRMLDMAIGREVWCSVAQVSEGKYRIDAVLIDTNRVAETKKLMSDLRRMSGI